MYQVKFSNEVAKDFKKLDRYTRELIYSWISKNLNNCENPRTTGKALAGNYKSKWRYRIGDYRLICTIEDDKLIILALTVGHRQSIYKK